MPSAPAAMQKARRGEHLTWLLRALTELVAIGVQDAFVLVADFIGQIFWARDRIAAALAHLFLDVFAELFVALTTGGKEDRKQQR